MSLVIPQNSIEVIETRASKIWLENGIAYVVMTGVKLFTSEDANEIFEARKKLSQGKTHPVIADISKAWMVSKGARDAARREEVVQLTSSIALITGSKVSIMLGNFFMGLNRPVFSVRLFTNHYEAEKWILTLNPNL